MDHVSQVGFECCRCSSDRYFSGWLLVRRLTGLIIWVFRKTHSWKQKLAGNSAIVTFLELAQGPFQKVKWSAQRFGFQKVTAWITWCFFCWLRAMNPSENIYLKVKIDGTVAQIPKGGLVKGPHKPICRDCAMYFSTTGTVIHWGRFRNKSIRSWKLAFRGRGFYLSFFVRNMSQR